MSKNNLLAIIIAGLLVGHSLQANQVAPAPETPEMSADDVIQSVPGQLPTPVPAERAIQAQIPLQAPTPMPNVAMPPFPVPMPVLGPNAPQVPPVAAPAQTMK